VRVEVCPDTNFDALRQQPGVDFIENKSLDRKGWYAPYRLTHQPLGANLEDFAIDAATHAPFGGLALAEYQRRAVSFIRGWTLADQGGVLAADPGLGKTVVALQANYLDGLLNHRGLVVGPNLARPVWCGPTSDATKYYGLNIVPLEGVKLEDVSPLHNAQCVFCHYEILEAWHAFLFAIFKPKWIIFDESHKLIHRGAHVTKAALNISVCNTVERRIELTGTPLPNQRLDLWPQLAVAQPGQWSYSPHAFGIRYCGAFKRPPEEGGFWDYSGESNDLELRARLAGVFLRITTEEVEGELPPIKRHVIDAELQDSRLLDEYSLAQLDVKKYLKLKGKVAQEVDTITIGNTTVKISKKDRKPQPLRLMSLTALVGILSQIKRDSAPKAVDTIIRDHNLLVVFTGRIETAEWIHNKLLLQMQTVGSIGGKQPAIFGPVDHSWHIDKRRALAEDFASRNCAIFVATIGSVGTAINELKAASAGLIVDLNWNTTSLTQAEKRICRKGCKASQVDIYYLIARNTVDDLFQQKIKEKAERARNVAEKDESGLQLVRDLSTGGADEARFDLDDFCNRLLEMSDSCN
jgi:SNF2 family DNA or RNA helicase